MSLGLLSLKCHLRWMLGAACLSMLCSAHSADTRPIEITAPRGQSINTNVNQLRLSGLKNLEADLSKPFQSLTPQSSLDGIMAPQPLAQPQRAPVLTQKEKQMRDRRNNWAFMSPEDFGPQLTPEKIFGLKEYGSDGLEKKDSTAVERFAERLNKSATNQLSQMDSDSTNLMGDDSSLSDPAQKNGVFPTLNPAVAVFKPASQPAPASDVFSFNVNRSDEDILREQKAQKLQVENFRQIWNYDQGASPAATAYPSTAGLSPAAAAAPTAAKTFEPVLGTATPARATPTPTVAPQSPPSRNTTFQPDFTAPQRRF